MTWVGERTSTADVVFSVRKPDTQPGDEVVVVGGHPALGDWCLSSAPRLSTHAGLFPTWTGKLALPRFFLASGHSVAFKYVVVRAGGGHEWEEGDNRMLQLVR